MVKVDNIQIHLSFLLDTFYGNIIAFGAILKKKNIWLTNEVAFTLPLNAISP